MAYCGAQKACRPSGEWSRSLCLHPTAAHGCMIGHQAGTAFHAAVGAEGPDGRLDAGSPRLGKFGMARHVAAAPKRRQAIRHDDPEDAGNKWE